MVYELLVETDPARQQVGLHLRDAHGVQLGSQQLRLDHSPALWEGLFDTRRYVLRFQNTLRLEGQSEAATAEQLLERLGVFLGEQVLGPDILAELMKTRQRRTLLVHLPNTACAKCCAMKPS